MNNIQVNVTDREFPAAKKFFDLEVGEFFIFANSNVHNVFLKTAKGKCMAIKTRSTWYGCLSTEGDYTLVIPVKEVKIDVTI